MSYFKLKFSKNISYQFKYSVQTETIQILSDYDKSLVYFQIMTKSHAPLTSLRSEKHNYLLARRLFRDKTVPFSSDVMCRYVSRFRPSVPIHQFKLHHSGSIIVKQISRMASFLPSFLNHTGKSTTSLHRTRPAQWKSGKTNPSSSSSIHTNQQ